MSVHKEIALDTTTYFHFAVNNTSGSAVDGTTPLFDVRLCGDTAAAAPILSGTPTLLTSASYSDGLYEVAIAATTGNGFDWFDHCAVFCTVTADSQNPAGFIGSFEISPRAAGILSMVAFTIDNTAFTATTSELETSDITEATAQHFVGGAMVFYWSADTTVYRIRTKCTAYSLSGGGRGHFTYDTIAATPPNGARVLFV